MEYSGLERLRDERWISQAISPASVLVFHRVTNEIPEDGITVTPDRFRQFMAMLASEYQPVSMETVLRCIRTQQVWPRRAVAVTFDDGYLDNYEVAAPILSEFKIPATFFITAGMIGTQRIAAYDRHLAGKVPWMEKRQLKELHHAGFEIGAHTVTHPDLGILSGDAAFREISDSKKLLEDILSAEVTSFAYPFGGSDNMSSENVELVKSAGFACCCSCYGGFVDLKSDPYNIQRIGVTNWFSSPEEFHFELRQIGRFSKPKG
jgi:peptidoglycan/xylan/chitin deacetylase (PgdA/CDA1 family)